MKRLGTMLVVVAALGLVGASTALADVRSPNPWKKTVGLPDNTTWTGIAPGNASWTGAPASSKSWGTKGWSAPTDVRAPSQAKGWGTRTWDVRAPAQAKGWSTKTWGGKAWAFRPAADWSSRAS